jgi:hypothetical protein
VADGYRFLNDVRKHRKLAYPNRAVHLELRRPRTPSLQLRRRSRGGIVRGMALEFDLNKTFDENTAEFRQHLEGIDAECAKILFDNLPTLLGDGNPTRAQANRSSFNEAVLENLKALLPKAETT